jgi:hypothetical protein
MILIISRGQYPSYGIWACGKIGFVICETTAEALIWSWQQTRASGGDGISDRASEMVDAVETPSPCRNSTLIVA